MTDTHETWQATEVCRPQDTHVQHTWQLTNDTDEINIDLWTDGTTVRIDGGPDDGDDDDRGHHAVDQLLSKYTNAGYRLVRDYPVNDPVVCDEAEEEPDGMDQRPDQCPECGTADMEYAPNHYDGLGEGAAWLCTGCKWGQWIAL